MSHSSDHLFWFKSLKSSKSLLATVHSNTCYIWDFLCTDSSVKGFIISESIFQNNVLILENRNQISEVLFLSNSSGSASLYSLDIGVLFIFVISVFTLSSRIGEPSFQAQQEQLLHHLIWTKKTSIQSRASKKFDV